MTIPDERSEYVRLERAVLCVDCDAIYYVTRSTCPSCSSGSQLPLAKVLNRDENNELVDALRALSKILVWAKRPDRKKEVPRADRP
jgi:hypothetical protein